MKKRFNFFSGGRGIVVLFMLTALITSCSANDKHLNEIYDKGRSSVNVVNRIQINEKRGYPFILTPTKSEQIKKQHGTDYVYKAKNGTNIRIVAVFKIFNEPDQSVYYILENEERKPVANVKLVTDEKGKIIKAEVIDGK